MNTSDWVEIWNRFDPERPEQEPRRRVPRSYGPAAKFSRLLDIPVGERPRMLLLGTVGCGKSTELLHIAEERASKEFVVFLPLETHFEERVGDSAALQKIATWEVCFLAGLAIYRAARERLGFVFASGTAELLRDAWLRAAGRAEVTDSPASFDLAKLGESLAVFATEFLPAGASTASKAVLSALKTATEGAKYDLPIGRAKRALPDQDDALEGLLVAVQNIVGQVQSAHNTVLLIIDGLDRVADTERARALLVDSSLLAKVPCAQIVCAPYALRHSTELVGVRGYRTAFLVNEPVLDRVHPERHGVGVEVMCSLFRLRVQDLRHGPYIDDALLREVAWFSGGHARDFVRLVRLIAESCLAEQHAQAQRADMNAAVDELRRLYEVGLHRGHVDVLNALARDPERRVADNPLVQQLLRDRRILPYPNESEWYFPHPLLTRTVIHPWPPGPTAS